MKQKRYWLRGGIITLIIVSTLMSLLYVIFPSKPGDFISAVEALVLLGMWPVTSIISSNVYSFFHSSELGSNLMTIISAIDYFLLGCALGWIYGKIKNRKQSGMMMN